jgi:hypothetical protein
VFEQALLSQTMRFLTPDECVTWCLQRGYPAGSREGYTIPVADKHPAGFHFAEFSHPADSGKKVRLARFLYSLIDPAPELLLWLGDWGVWPSSQHMPLFTRFRQAFGEQRPLIDTPGHLVTPAEADDAISIITVSLQFIWDCDIITVSGRDVIFISHDEYGRFGSRDAPAADLARQQIENAMQREKVPGTIGRLKHGRS